MKAAQINKFGHADVVQVVEVDKPVVEPSKVLVEVHAASINPYDTTVREGKAQLSTPLTLPITLGGDLAGVVAEVAPDVTAFKPGDKVYGQANAVSGNSGAFAEFAVTKAESLAPAPHNTNFAEAAALPLVGVSALQALTEHIKLQSGQKIFIHGGAGGIGTMAIQIAKHIGAFVATTATGDGIAYVKKLGADQVIDYKKQSFAEELHDFDAVFDTVGGEDFTRALAVLKPGTVAVSMIAQPNQAVADSKGVTAFMQFTHVTAEKLNTLRQLVEDKVITPHVDKIFPLADVQKAFEARESGTVKGKVVLQIK